MDRLPAYVIGSGIAGLRFSLYLAETHPVILVTKKATLESNTNYAQGGVAAAVGLDDSVDLHHADTMATGAGLSEERIVRLVVEEGPQLVLELIDMGATFARDSAGQLALGREGGHSRHRVIHAADHTGSEIERVLVNAAENHPNIRILPYHLAVDVIVRDGAASGVVLLEPSGEVRIAPSALVCLATGGLGRVFRATSNPEIATGDGVAIGYRAGAVLRDLEFIQFHPTTLAKPGQKAFLISEAVRGEGGILTTIRGERFMKKYEPKMMELAPRDVVARAIDTEMKKSGDPHVLLDVTHLGADFLRRRFPTIHTTCLEHGVDITREPIPVSPAAHYSCGGVVTDEQARTSVRRLYAIGETASHGLHGANRLASNSLLEALVFARRGARAAAAEYVPASPVPARILDLPRRAVCGLTELYADRLRATMSQHVGIFRTDASLLRARVETGALLAGVKRLLRQFVLTRELIELANMAQCADLIVRCALQRKESRGLHKLEEGTEADPRLPGVHSEVRADSPGPLLPDAVS